MVINQSLLSFAQILASFLEIGLDSEDVSYFHKLFHLIRKSDLSSTDASLLSSLLSHCRIRAPNKLVDLIQTTAWVDHSATLIPDPFDVEFGVGDTQPINRTTSAPNVGELLLF